MTACSHGKKLEMHVLVDCYYRGRDGQNERDNDAGQRLC